MPQMPAWTARFRDACRDAGFDLVAWMNTAWCADDPTLRLESFGRAGSLAAVVAHSRAFWPVLVDALRRDADLLSCNDVIDTYTERVVGAAAAATGLRFEAGWAHQPVPIQRLAERAGLAWLSPAHLAVHPEFGPWIGLRAVIAFDAAAPPGPAPIIADPCGACEHACRGASEAARDEDWRTWLAVRDACPLGRTHRYSDQQIRYHYTKDRNVLRAAVATTSVLPRSS